MTAAHYDRTLRGIVNVAILLLSQRYGVEAEDVFNDLDQPDERQHWRQALIIRRQAIYLAHAGFNLPQAHIAQALHITRQAVSKMVIEVEAERASSKVDLVLEDFSRFATRGVSWVNRQSNIARSASRISRLNSSLASLG